MKSDTSTIDILDNFESESTCCSSKKRETKKLRGESDVIIPKQKVQLLWKKFRTFVWSFIRLRQISKLIAEKNSCPIDENAMNALPYNPLTEKKKTVFVFLPGGKLREIWETIRSLILLLDYIFTFYIFFFEESKYLILNILILPLSLDMVYRCFLAYYDDIKLELELKKTAKKYLLGSFFIDLLATIPFYLLMGHFYLFPRFLRIYRVGELKSMLVHLQIPICEYLNLSLAGIQHISRLVFLVFYMLLFSHMSSCYWVYLGREPEGWVERESEQNTLDSESSLAVYIAAFYFVLTTLTSVGYGDITGSTMDEMLAMMILQIIGLWCYCALLWDINQIISLYSDSQEASKEDELGIWLMRLDRKKPIRLKPAFFIHIIEFYHHFWMNNLSSVKAEEFFDELTPQLQTQLIDYLSEKPVSQKFETFFQGTDIGFRRGMAMNMQYCEFKKHSRIDTSNDPIIEKGNKFNRIYFIIKGNVKVCSSPTHELFKIGTGSFFGESNILFNYPSSYLYKTEENEVIKAFSVKKRIFLKFCKMYPKSFKLLKERAMIRRRKLREVKQNDLQTRGLNRQKYLNIGKYCAKAAIMALFGVPIPNSSSNKEESSILTFSSHEEDYFSDGKSEESKVGMNLGESMEKSSNPETLNTYRYLMEYEKTAKINIENSPKACKLKPKKISRIRKPGYHPSTLQNKATDKAITMQTQFFLIYLLNPQSIDNPVKRAEYSRLLEVENLVNTPRSKKHSQQKFGLHKEQFIQIKSRMNEFQIINDALNYNSEEEYGIEDAIEQKYISGTLYNRVEGIENRLKIGINNFEEEISRIKKRLMKAVHVVNEILA